MKLPYIDLYIGDWLKDSVAGCSLAAQGLWLRLLFIMQESPERGRLLKQNAKQASSGCSDLLEPMDDICLARRCGCSLDEFQALMTELWEAGVPGIENGIIFSRRMVKDEALRKIRSEAGRKGGEARMLGICLGKTSIKTKANADDDVDNAADGDVGDDKIRLANDARKIIHYLNEKTGAKFRESSTSLTPIMARLSERDVTLGSCFTIIDRQCKMWQGSSMAKYLRPETLFNKTKFDGYFAARELPIPVDETEKPYQPNI